MFDEIRTWMSSLLSWKKILTMQILGHRVERRIRRQIVECVLFSSADLSVHVSVVVGAHLRSVQRHLLVE